MLDWKILAAGIAALVVVAVVAAADAGPNALSGIIRTLTTFLGTSPFGNLFSVAEESSEIGVVIYPPALSLALDRNTVIVNAVTLSNFSGTASLDFVNKTITLQEAGSRLRLASPLERTVITDLKIPRLLAENVRLEVVSGKYNISSANGTVEIIAFSGNATITSDSLTLIGNATRVERR